MEARMKIYDYRVESAHSVAFRFVSAAPAHEHLFSDAPLAVALAAKSVTVPAGEEVRVVHVPTGEVIFRKSGPAPLSDDE